MESNQHSDALKDTLGEALASCIMEDDSRHSYSLHAQISYRNRVELRFSIRIYVLFSFIINTKTNTGHTIIGVIIFIFDLILFVCLRTAMITRFVLEPESWLSHLFTHLNASSSAPFGCRSRPSSVTPKYMASLVVLKEHGSLLPFASSSGSMPLVLSLTPPSSTDSSFNLHRIRSCK